MLSLIWVLSMLTGYIDVNKEILKTKAFVCKAEPSRSIRHQTHNNVLAENTTLHKQVSLVHQCLTNNETFSVVCLRIRFFKRKQNNFRRKKIFICFRAQKLHFKDSSFISKFSYFHQRTGKIFQICFFLNKDDRRIVFISDILAKRVMCYHI